MPTLLLPWHHRKLPRPVSLGFRVDPAKAQNLQEMLLIGQAYDFSHGGMTITLTYSRTNRRAFATFVMTSSPITGICNMQYGKRFISSPISGFECSRARHARRKDRHCLGVARLASPCFILELTPLHVIVGIEYLRYDLARLCYAEGYSQRLALVVPMCLPSSLHYPCYLLSTRTCT